VVSQKRFASLLVGTGPISCVGLYGICMVVTLRSSGFSSQYGPIPKSGGTSRRLELSDLLGFPPTEKRVALSKRIDAHAFSDTGKPPVLAAQDKCPVGFSSLPIPMGADDASQ
jgi:hypothetical protein